MQRLGRQTCKEAARDQETEEDGGQGAAPEVGVRQSIFHCDAPSGVQRHHQRQQRQGILTRLHSTSGSGLHHHLMCAMFVSWGLHLALAGC